LPVLVPSAAAWAQENRAEEDVLIRALVDELERSTKNLVLEDLGRPYFIQYSAKDTHGVRITADYGGVTAERDNRRRSLSTRVRVGSYELDNTNTERGGGGAWLPIENDYEAIRQAIWLATDADYKRAVEILTWKKAYLQTKEKDEERPDDFSRVEPVQHIDPPAELTFDRKKWKQAVKELSARFKQHPDIQQSSVTYGIGWGNFYLVNSEGTRLRRADTGVDVRAYASLQAKDGMYLADSLTYVADRPENLPSIEKILADIDQLCERLVIMSEAEILEHYTGPILFSAPAACIVFESMLGEQFCARPLPLMGRSWPEESMERKIGRRILPRTFTVYDDPTVERFNDTLLVGNYKFDDEAVPARRVTLVEGGTLKTLLAGRAPTRKMKQSTGHGRSGGYGDAESTIACLFFSDEAGLPENELREEFIQAVQDEGLEFGIRVDALEDGGSGYLGDPIRAYKVYAADGREEPIRGVEFLPVEVRALRRLLAAGKNQHVHSDPAVPASIAAPSILFEELELTKIEEEWDKLPILKAPAIRK
jgi:predicted Zn-dependent protease